MSGSRDELLHNAVLFLLDPKVRESSLTSRITFLEGKGLNEAEIQEALRRAGAGEGGVSSQATGGGGGTSGWGGGGGGYVGGARGYSTMQMLPPATPRRDWRDVFIMAVISGGVVYGLSALARKYLLPHLRPPTTTAFQQTSQSLEDQYDEAQALLTSLTTSTNELKEQLEADRERVGVVVADVEEAVKGVKENEERWREEMREVRGEVESVRELVPKMIEKHSSTQSAALSDLQNELRSLKALLQSRTQPPPNPPSSASSQPSHPSQPSYTSPSGANASESPPPSLASSTGSLSNSGGVSSTTAAANALLGAPKGRGIPAWQKSAGSPGGSRSSTPVPTAASASASDGEDKKDEAEASASASAGGSS